MFSLLSLYATLGVERRRKSTGVAKNGIGLCQLPVGVGGALRVCSGWDCRDTEMGGMGQKEGLSPVVWGKFGVDGAIKKPRQAWRLAVAKELKILIVFHKHVSQPQSTSA